MNELVIIGSGFSSFIIAQKLKRFNPIIISQNNKINTNFSLFRKNLLTNKILTEKALSYGNFKYILNNNTNLHDRLSLGGNTNMWGGFIDTELLPQSFINDFIGLKINFTKLNLKTNGYKSNIDTIKQLRNNQDKILNVSDYIKEYINGFVDSINVKNNLITINYINNKNKIISILTKKLFLGISFPQLVDLFFRSHLINKNLKITLSEFSHQFIINFDKDKFKGLNENKVSIKYDLIRAIKHFFGYQYSLDRLNVPIPIFVDQNFYYKKRFIGLNLDLSENIIQQYTNNKFGDSIHYCNLTFNDEKITKYINNISRNIIGISTPFIDQKKPGPISNDIVNNIWNNY